MKRVFVLLILPASWIFNACTAYALQTSNSLWFEDGNEATSEESGGLDENIELSQGKIFIKTEDLDHDILKVSIKCEGLETPVLGTAFHLFYDKNLISFLRYDPGNFLEKGGDPFYIVSAEKDVNSAETGEIIFGETLRRNDNFPVGDGIIADFYFQKIGEFPGVFGDEFSGNEFPGLELNFKNGVVSTMDTTRQDLDTVDFVNFKYGEKFKSQDSENLVKNTNSYQANVLGSFNSFSIIFVIAAGLAFGTAIVFFLKYKKIKAKI